MSKKSRKHKICTNICDVSACVRRLHTLFGTCKESAQHKSSKTLYAALLTITRPTPEPTTVLPTLSLLATHAVCCALLLEIRLELLCAVFAACLPVCCLSVCLCFRAFAYLLSFRRAGLSPLSRFVSFSAAVAAAAAASAAAATAWAWHSWLFGDACLFLSSFAPRDDGPAKFCPCFKNCSVLNFVSFGFIIRTHTHTCTCTCTNFPQSSQHQIPRCRHTPTA